MIVFDPPAGFADVSEYAFAADDRRLTIRHTTEVGTPADLARVGREHAARLRDLFGAIGVEVSEVQSRADGTAYVTVTAPVVGAEPHAATDRSAFLLFRTGLAVELTLTARPEDAGARPEFDRLVETVRPAVQAPGPRSIGSREPAGGTSARRAGPIWVELPARYRDRSVLAFRDPEGTRSLSIEVADVSAAGRAAPPPTPLFASLAGATDDRGATFAYEAGPDPWSARSVRTRAAGPAAEGAKAPGEATITEVRQVGAEWVTIRVRSSGPDPAARQLAEQVARSARPAP